MNNNRLKITHFIPVYAPAWQFGGPILSVSRLCEALVKIGHEVNVLTTNAGLPQLSDEELGHIINRNGVKVTYFPVDQQGGAIRSNALQVALMNCLQDIDILHLSSIWQPLGISAQREAYRLDIPVIQSLRGALGPYSRSKGWWKKIPYYYLKERPWLQKAAGLHVTTVQEAEELTALKLKAPCHLLANPIDLENLRIDAGERARWRQKYKINDGVPLLMICGRQHHKKGLDLLPSVLQQLKQLSWEIVLVGHDEDGSGARFKNDLKRYNLESRLIDLASQPAQKLNSIYNAADLLLLPSRHENFGNVVIEALASGCAVAVSDKTGVGGDLLKGAPANFGAVLPREPHAWADWLATWLNKPQRAGKNCAQWAAQRYSSEAVANQAVAIYQQILESRPR